MIGGGDFSVGELFLGIGADMKSSVALISTVVSGTTPSIRDGEETLCFFATGGGDFGEREQLCDLDRCSRFCEEISSPSTFPIPPSLA